ncbi:MAG: lipoyl(octanoyl) transferase LipB [Cytophagaceae bacterium]
MYKHTNKTVLHEDLGLIDYATAWDYQTKIFDSVIHQKLQLRDLPEDQQIGPSNYILTCEHPHVYTLGKSGDRNHLLISEEGLKEAQASYYEINRGGDITYHGPGQLVVYPIFDLDNFFTDIHKYLRFLEEAVILTLYDFGIKAGRVDGLTGVWLDGDQPLKARKICAMGVKASRWVTMHGLALNVHADLNYFKNIVPCGIDDKAVTSLHLELKEHTPKLEEVKVKLLQHIAELFEITNIERALRATAN